MCLTFPASLATNSLKISIAQLTFLRSDLIPYPSVDPPSLATIFNDQRERKTSRAELETLNQEASREPTSIRLQRTLEDLQQLLRADEVTTFSFRRPKHFPSPASDTIHHSNGATHASLQPNLSPLTNMVLKNTQIQFRYPTPESPISKSEKQSPSPAVEKGLKLQREVQAQNAATFQRNARISAFGPVPQTPPHASPGGPAIVIPTLPRGSQRSDYQEFPEVEARAQSGEGLSRKRQPDEFQAENEALSLSLDQRGQSDAVVYALQEQLTNILEAEDLLEPDDTGAVSTEVAQYFEFGQVADSDAPILSPNAQSKLLSTIQNVVSFKRFSEISVEQLSRIRKLCEDSVSTLESISLNVGTEWSELDVEEWVQRVETAGSRLQAARLLLRIMTAGRDEKQLYSEDLVSQAINGLNHIVDMFVVPAVETRNSETNRAMFTIFSTHRKQVGYLLQTCGRVLKLLGDFLIKVDVSESATASVEFLATQLVFVENAHSEKDSAVGIQRFEVIRLVAMDVIAKIFARHVDQRTSIFDDILTSLEKLPVTRQSARQFKLADGKPIQLVSALLMRLVQTCGTSSLDKTRSKPGANLSAIDKGEDGVTSDEEEPISPAKRVLVLPVEQAQHLDGDQALFELNHAVQPLYSSALASAQYVIRFIVQRALTATKTGDQPYRNLLDIFTEDFLSVLGSPEWPGAELLLQALLMTMIGQLQADKTPVPAKNMALDLMGLMGSGISDLQILVRNAMKAIDISESDVSAKLFHIAEDVLEEKQTDMDFIDFDGPWRMVIEHSRETSMDDAQAQGSRGFHTTQWAKSALLVLEPQDVSDDDETNPPKKLMLQLRNAVLDPEWMGREYEFEPVSRAQSRLASALLTLNLPFCKNQKRIFGFLLANITSEHATLKSRSLKSVVQLLEKDPSILDHNGLVLSHILKSTSDNSSLVRDSALGILGKCLSLRPEFEGKVYHRIIERTKDNAIPVRKRSMKLLKEIYLHNTEPEVKSRIADALLQLVNDLDEGVADLARQIFEEIWIAPFHGVSVGEDAPLQQRMALQKQMSLITRTVQRGESVLSVLDTLLQSVLSNSSKHAVANFKVCKAMVALMFDIIVDNGSMPDKPSQQHVLQTLTVFAKSNAKLFTAQQLELLRPYTKNLASQDDLPIFRSAVVIFRHVFPSLSTLQHAFLKEVQSSLLGALSKISPRELEEVAPCIWSIDGVLKNTDRLVRMLSSSLKQIHMMKDADLSNNQPMVNKLLRYMYITGYMGNACNFEDRVGEFQDAITWWEGKSVAALIIDIILPFTRQKQPELLRETALKTIGMICRAFAHQFIRTDVGQAFQLPFLNEDSRLELIVLSAFQAFFAQEERRSESGAEIKVGEGEVHGSERLGKSLVGTGHDGASTGIAQRFLPYILKLALSTPGELALKATQVIASINRQGLVHPKECGPALVALETSTDSTIANIAFVEHRSLHHKHETMFEKEYMKAVYQAFQYQNKVLSSPGGLTFQPYAAKLRSAWEVLKQGNSKVRKRFLSNICTRSNFELPKLDTSQDGPPEHVLFTRFCMENLAFFNYSRTDEILHLVSSLEKVVTGTGTPVAHAIETDVLKMKLEPESNQAPLLVEHIQDATVLDNGQPPMVLPIRPAPVSEDIDPSRLHQLATASTILMMIWETRTFIRRLWGLQKQSKSSAALANGTTGKAKVNAKDLNKSAYKVPGITADKYVDRIASLVSNLSPESRETELSTCRAFAELLSVDNEFRVASEDDYEGDLAKAAARYETPSEDEGSQGGIGQSGGGRGRKRKASVGAGNTPKRPRIKKTPSKRGPGRPRKRSGSKSSADDEAGGGWD